ncbi:hypothetical protein HY004_01150 [Candidatus Saccharibacteria bacterium]|nr:hypothetical protein [Candidatus Saccharibacteria bacterium]
MHAIKNKQSGVASIFVVVFFTLLISIIVVGFVQLVNQDQRQSTNADLNSSAYDSSQAGIEDGKRALEQYKRDCIQTSKTSDPVCTLKYTDAGGALTGDSCSALRDKIGVSLGLDTSSTSEVKITTNNTNDLDLDQAYTCLKVKYKTTDAKYDLESGSPNLIPLKTSDGAPEPGSIAINWFNKSQGQATPGGAISNFRLPTSSSNWGNNNPPIIRAQIMALPHETSAGTTVSPIDMQVVDDSSRAVFLYPSTAGTVSPIDIGANYDSARTKPKYSPIAVKCDPEATYTCSAVLTGFKPGASTYDYYLRLTAIYKDAPVQVQMFSNTTATGTPLDFDGVNPEIDSTGRANNVYRRLVSRVSPQAKYDGIDVSQGICKAFHLADFATTYGNDGCPKVCLYEDVPCTNTPDDNP